MPYLISMLGIYSNGYLISIDQQHTWNAGLVIPFSKERLGIGTGSQLKLGKEFFCNFESISAQSRCFSGITVRYAMNETGIREKRNELVRQTGKSGFSANNQLVMEYASPPLPQADKLLKGKE